MSVLSDSVLQHLSYHVFLPPKLPQEEQTEALQRDVDLAIVRSVKQASERFKLETGSGAQWDQIQLMLERLHSYIERPLEKIRLAQDIKSMKEGDILSIYLKAQNAGLTIRKQSNDTIFEVFEVQAQTGNVMSTPGKIVRHFPGAAVQIPNSVANESDFIDEVANILAQMNTEVFDAAYPKSQKAGADVRESRDSINPNYFVQFFFGVLRGIGSTIEPPRVVKRLADEVLWKSALHPWRRSPIWLIIRVALQTSLDSTTTYKNFIAYYHATILSQCNNRDSFSSDLLYAMRVKMARRLYKIQDTALQFVIAAVETAADGIQHQLQGRWDAVQSAQAKSRSPDLSSLDQNSAINHTLPHSRSYLDQVFKGRSSHANNSKFSPSHSSRLENITEFSQYANGGLSRAFGNDPHLALFDFEAAVFANLTSWTAHQSSYSSACAILSSCFGQYSDAGKSYYATDIADQSIMVLTLMRIWMAIDELALKETPLMSKFSPEFSPDILDPLLLRTSPHLDQARLVQQYIRTRNDAASSSNPSIFSDQASSSCFAVQYFNSSSRHQQIKREIEDRARREKNDKIEELTRLNARYNQLSNEIQGTSCTYYYDDGWQRHNQWSCSRCSKIRERTSLRIQLYEWPLPRNQYDAEAVVFELHRPESFTVWRDITYAILVDIGTPSSRSRCDQKVTLEGYDALSSWLSSSSTTPRIIMASSTKLFVQSHYSNASLPNTESEVCRECALHFQLYDKNGGAWASSPASGVSFAKFGTLKLPSDSSYRYLEYSLEKTTHTSNQVLADQYHCPKELSLHEHIAFGTLRSGGRLQWMNIVRGLEEDLLTFSSEEIWLLHTQAAWQIGPLSNDGSREWHEELGREEFGRLLISECERMLVRVKANWLQAKAVLTIVTLVNRLMASSPAGEVVNAACNFLREGRIVAHKWLGELLLKLENATHEDDVIGYQHRVCEMAAICRATYDVEPCHMTLVLSSPDDYAALIKASICLYDNQPPDISNAPKSLQTLLCRDRRFSHKVVPHMLTSIRRGDDILSNPLHKLWPDFRLGSAGWRVFGEPNSRWVTTTTAAANGSRAQEVHINLITGQLLIDSKPLGRLPRNYVEHATYIRLFGQKILDVVPAKSLGMEFATRSQVHGYQVSFALERSSGQLIVQAQKDDRIFELVPHEKLSADFPLFFSEDYHHWADLKNKTVEFRPITAPWSADECRWRLRFDGSRATTLANSTGVFFLVDIHSALFRSLAHSISPLESDRYLHVTQSANDGLQIELPRMKLSFFVNEAGQIESRNFRDQVLDENQSAGTLFGLKNQLLLRAKDTVAQSFPRSRSVLIPDGQIEYTMQNHHVSVSIRFDSRRAVDVYRYKVDSDLRHLAPDAGLTSRLFKIYLHALTSHCLPDPLTGRTGTEEALNELSQASTSSFEQINLKQAELLKSIGLLTPKREYYPEHLQCMQTTHWLNLPPLSQHFAFSFAAAAVLRRADSLQIFHKLDFELDEYLAALEYSDTLMKRTTRQMAVYYPSDANNHVPQILGSTSISDKLCPGRDNLVGEWEEKGQHARWASGLAYQNWGIPVFKSYDLVSLAESWGTLNDTTECDTLSYRSSWFDISLNSSWINLYNLLRKATVSSNRYMLSSCLASIAFGQTLPTDLIPVFISFATNPEYRTIEPPSHNIFKLAADRYEPDRARVDGFASTAAYSVSSSPAGNLTRNSNETGYDLHCRQQSYYNSNLPSHRSQFVNNLMDQWPRTNPQPSIQLHSPNSEHSRWFSVNSCLNSTQDYFSSCIWNIKLRDHLRQLERALTSRSASYGMGFTRLSYTPVNAPVAAQVPGDPWSVLNVPSLMKSRTNPEPTDILLFSKFVIQTQTGPKANTSRLQDLFAEFQQSQSALNRQYAADLDESRRELDSKPSPFLLRNLSPATVAIVENIRGTCKNNVEAAFERVKLALGPKTDVERIVSVAGIWPRLTPRTLLQQLSLQNRPRLHSLPKWRDELVGYAQVFADHQRSQRLAALAESQNTEEFYKELDLASSQDDPGLDDPDWLLVQIDGNFGARSVQRQVAKEMISPSSGSNTALQLNMGEGKSSVIVPIIASSLADSSKLVRVVVLKPLWRQMFDLLVNRLSGLANRRIYYLPFNRDIKIDSASTHKLRGFYEECMREGGILLAQPEHILSFKLMGIDRLIFSRQSNEREEANTLRDMQDWLTTHTRDILDESDEILHVRYQLVYTVGEQQPLYDHPDRWTTTQQLLRLATTHIERLQQEYPTSFSHKHRDHGQFPAVRIMPDCPDEAARKLISAVATDVRNGRLLNLTCDRLLPSVRSKLVEFFTNNDLPYSDYDYLRQHCDPAMWKGLLLIRGLLASGILIFALKHKYYRVDYGLDLNRFPPTSLAVPYRAKDIPSLRAEFGHPDVTVVLTCFSYYYHGLTDQQLDHCFKLLFKLDNPAQEYEEWVKRDDATPEDLRQLNGVNIEDREQFTERLVPTFSHNSATIDFFLSMVVFPKEAKEFPEKLATSGWDLAERKNNYTTGFSGTNDNRYLLPTSIIQADPVKQLSTNALVLTYLLQPENNHYVCTRDDAGRNLSTAGFLKLLVAQKPEVRVLLDVGAQMLELQNEELVRCWLGLRPDIEAAVYFNDRDELVALPQNGTPVLLSTSPFAQRFDKCIVYLDDGHTRGTDLKLPRETRAMVTLGPKVTKDRLLQGCMRMRKLGHGQSVMFAAPPEIDTQIRNASPTPIGRGADIDALDVLRWAMLETCKDLQHHVSHWAHQGIEFDRRHATEKQYQVSRNVSELQKGWTTPESRLLEQMYGVLSPNELRNRAGSMQRAFEVPALKRGLETLGVVKLEDPSMDEEQEREVNHEVEKEQNIQRPGKGQPINPSVHPDVKHFITNGSLPTNRSGILPLFYPFCYSYSQIYNSWSSLLFASTDFLQTIVSSPTDRLSEHMRPVNWILTGRDNVRVVLGPHEVNELLPLIRNSTVVRLHVYAPKVSISMLSFSELQFYSIPASPNPPTTSAGLSAAQLQLDLFAGQLYLSSYQDYASLCVSLGLFVPSGSEEDQLVEVQSDGFVQPKHREALIRRKPEYRDCQFTTTPIPALKDLVGLRRKGMSYLRTHIGQILHARSMAAEDF